MTTKPLHYAEHAPPPALRDVVVSLWTFGARMEPGETVLHHVWPDGCASLFVSMAPGRPAAATVAGPVLDARRIPVVDGLFVCGVRFWPDSAGAALRVEPTTLRERSVPAATLLGGDADVLARTVAAVSPADAPAVLAGWLLARLAGTVPPDAVVRDAVRAIVRARGELPIARVAAAVGLSPRQLQRRFRAATGLTPKEYARIRRMRGALAELLRGELPQAALARALGFADQAHLARELRELTGLTPGALRERLGIIEHVDVTP